METPKPISKPSNPKPSTDSSDSNWVRPDWVQPESWSDGTGTTESTPDAMKQFLESNE